jgi:simple sugar transport system ATP-binding protein
LTASAVEFLGVSKCFGPVAANRAISFAVASGTIHGIIGENGAGKSTLMEMLSGRLPPDAGEIRISGEPVRFRSAADAIARGIGMVHQHFLLVEPMSVLENLVLGVPGARRAAEAAARAALAELGSRYGLTLDPEALVAALPVGLRQRLEILKALHRGAEILILDEPTAVLTPEETDQFFVILRRLAAEGRTILLITHKLREIMAVASRVTVLRQGQVVADLDVAETSESALAALMIGRTPAPPARVGGTVGAAVLSARGLAAPGLGPIDLDLRAGEVVGIAGVAGNGQTELLQALAGLLPASGTLTWSGKPVPLRGRARALRRLGLAHIPEDRLGMGLVRSFAAWETAILGTHRDLARRGFLPVASLSAAARGMMLEWDVRPADEMLSSASFSGGNQQKLVAAREIGRGPAVLLVGQPTRGVDIGAIETIHRRILALKAAGAAILIVSVELDEILALADRIQVMADGRFTGELPRAAADEARLGLLMAGVVA